MLTNLKRATNFALTDFYRNQGMSVAAIFILSVTILLVTGLFFLHGINQFLVTSIQSKIDITAYFTSDTGEQDILQIKQDLAKNIPTIKNIDYVSKDEALAAFTEKHQDNSVFSRALNEVGDNPFLPALNITTSGETQQYQQIAEFLQQPQYAAFIQKVDFSQKKDTIQKVFAITSGINRVGLGVGIFLILVAILVVFNTIKLVIDASREEISTMRIVGASAWFVRAPFIIEGALFGALSFIFCFIATLVSAYFLTPVLAVIMPGFSLFGYFVSTLLFVILIQLGTGVGLGVIASFIVVRKYLRI